MISLKSISFGGTAAIMANMALIVGLQAAAPSKVAIITSLLIIAIADNLADALSIHLYQESEGLEPKAAFIVTVANYFVRLSISLTFIPLIYFLTPPVATAVCILWGLVLLCAITFFLARQRNVSVGAEILKHVFVAATIIFLSKEIGHGIFLKMNG